MSLVAELRRRNVFRVAAAYLVVGWLLTEVLTTILPTLGAPDWAARAVILIFAFGFIPAVVFSWFYELTSEGIKREREVERDEIITTKTGKKLDYITVTSVVILIVFVGLFSARQTGDDSAPVEVAVSDASVAVLPFVNMSNDKDNEYFSDGLTETLLHMLTQVPDLKVAARTSSFAFKGKNISVQQIAAALEVAHVLEGSVQRVGDRVRVTAQLIRASDGFHIWSSSYDRTLDDIFGVQDEIAEKVGYALSHSLLGAGGRGKLAGVNTTDPDAYDLYLQARKERVTYSYGGLQASENLLKGALIIDPGFLDAKTELAANYVAQSETGLLDSREVNMAVKALSDQVLAERPDDVVARAFNLYAKAMLQATEGDLKGISDLAGQLEAIVAKAPGELQPRLLLLRAYHGTQQFERSVPILRDALRRDPFNPQIHYELGTLFARLEDWDSAKASLEKSLEIEPAQPNAYLHLGKVNLQLGDGAGAVQNFLRALETDPKDHELPGMLAAFLYQLELFEAGDDFRDRVMAIAPTSEMAYGIELLRAINSGDEEASIRSARRAIEDDIDDRQFAFSRAVQYLLRVAATRGTVAAEIAWMERQAPGILDFRAESVPLKYRRAQYMAFDAWFVSLPREELLQRLDMMLQGASSYGFDLEQDPAMRFEVLALRGEVEQAIEVALAKVFTRSVAMHLDWQQTLVLPQFREIVADPRVQAAMQRWEDEEAALRGQVQAYLADLHATT
ncbi:MAG: tetratricopeptide repeat protein [Gammaproteobacteria bacterium]|nr:tetratricopeptide repeat protein [Gammaproteobacteria bacterium]MDH3372451.1 tetratricopeptide repeat protein [Gammaproteobacteria bacterium]MDH3407886.1 tetratricopeptide repeat protein [Gammaproteobacteria bacterium]MDH3551345.1 tetratricopeptide repeat protein [Gammaproteobacteria bacterium]